MRWSTKKRLEFIESRLFWDGKISRKDLTDYFDVSIPQATKDLKQYAELAPENIKYDASAKQYVTGDDFRRTLAALDSETYLSHLTISYLEKTGDFFCGRLPESYMLPSMARSSVNNSILQVIHNCIQEGLSVLIEYQSMNGPDPTMRMISPHALGFDGARWHVRALCHNRKQYRDFNLNRIISTGERRKISIDHSNDYLWHTNISYKISPHSALSPSQRKVIENEYSMTNSEIIIEIKAAFHFYLIERLGLRIEKEKGSGKQQHIVLKNRKEIETKISLLNELESSRIKELPL